MNIPWNDYNLKILPTISKNSLFHSVLLSVYPEYQKISQVGKALMGPRFIRDLESKSNRKKGKIDIECISKLLCINIFMFEDIDVNTYIKNYSVPDTETNNPTIIIVHNGSGYNSIGLELENGCIQTVFYKKYGDYKFVSFIENFYKSEENEGLYDLTQASETIGNNFNSL